MTDMTHRILKVEVPYWSNERLIVIEQLAPGLPVQVGFQITRSCWPCKTCAKRLEKIETKIAGTDARIGRLETAPAQAKHMVIWELDELPKDMKALIEWLEERLDLGLEAENCYLY